MTKDKVHINNFIKHLFDENYAEAKADLQAVVSEKIKLRMKDEIAKESKKESK